MATYHPNHAEILNKLVEACFDAIEFKSHEAIPASLMTDVLDVMQSDAQRHTNHQIEINRNLAKHIPLLTDYYEDLALLYMHVSGFIASEGASPLLESKLIELKAKLDADRRNLLQWRLYRGLPWAVNQSQCLLQAQAVYRAIFDKSIESNRLELHEFFQQWGSTAMGFPGAGGAAITTAITSVVVFPNKSVCVFFANRLAYFIKNPSPVFWMHLLEEKEMLPVNRRNIYEDKPSI